MRCWRQELQFVVVAIRPAGQHQLVTTRQSATVRLGDRADQKPRVAVRERPDTGAAGGEKYPRKALFLQRFQPLLCRMRRRWPPPDPTAGGPVPDAVRPVRHILARRARSWWPRTGGSRRRRRRCVRPCSQRRSPSTPPNPPMRTAPTGSAGSGTRPASELTMSTCGCSRAANARALSGAAEQQHPHQCGRPGCAVRPNTGSCR